MKKRLLIFAALLAFLAPWFKPMANAALFPTPSGTGCMHGGDMCPMKARALHAHHETSGHNHQIHDNHGKKEGINCPHFYESGAKDGAVEPSAQFSEMPFIITGAYQPTDQTVAPFAADGEVSYKDPLLFTPERPPSR